MSNEKILHMIGNGHLDPVWLWRWQEGFQAAKATFRSVLDRMNECEDFVFTSSSAAVYEWIEQNEPRMFAEIQQRVAEGRWYLAGGWWLQPDCNLPSGESFARQALYGQRYFQQKFGVVATVGYNVDSFGHHGMLPQILRKSGCDSYVFTRPETFEKGLPGRVFWWESDDGSRVMAYRIPFEYCTWGKDLERHVRRCQPELRDPVDELMCFYGVGNHGGGPTRENLESIRRMDADLSLPRLAFSTPRRFFDAVQAGERALPVVHGELQHHAVGCYAAHSGVKRWNRQAEQMLVTAEKWSTVAALVTGQSYPRDELLRAWKGVLFNQFHDILAGTSLEVAYEDARNMHGEAMAIGERALNYAIQSLSWQIGIEAQEGMTPIVVFNPHTWPVTAPVEVEMSSVKEPDGLVDDVGEPVPLQFVRASAVVSGWRRRLCFLADLPALGYRVYRIVPNAALAAPSAISASEHTLENELFRLVIDPETGYIASLTDKRHDYEVFLGPAARPEVIEDRSDTWSHGVYQFQEVVGAFKAERIELRENGPVKAVLRVESSYGASRLIQDFTMYQDRPQIDVGVTVDWHEQWKVLKLRFAANLNFLKAAYEIPFGTVERPTNGDEEPGLSWIDLSGEARGAQVAYGVSLLNDGKYSFDIKGRQMSITVLRSPIYAHHIPTEPRPDERYSFIDQGTQRFSYTILPHEGGWPEAQTVRRAAELNQAPVVQVESYHGGALPPRASYCGVDQPNIVVSAIKQAEDNDDTIIRCYETERTTTATMIHLPAWGRVIEARFGPCEIKTFRIPRDHELPVVETNLIEWDAP